MDKPAETQHPVHDLIRARWSPRAFSSRTIEPSAVRSMLEAARWAASCFNEQPWRFIVAPRTDEPRFAQLLSCLSEPNRVWAQHAAVLILSVARRTFTMNDQPNRHALHDVGLAAAQLTMQATALGVSVHQMAGFSTDAARREYEIPSGFEPVAVLALGYPGDADALPDPLREREHELRARRPQVEFVFAGRWGTPLDTEDGAP